MEFHLSKIASASIIKRLKKIYLEKSAVNLYIISERVAERPDFRVDADVAYQLQPTDSNGNSNGGEQRIHLQMHSHTQIASLRSIQLYIISPIPIQIQGTKSNKNQ